MTKVEEAFAPAANPPQMYEGQPTHEEIELRAYQIFVERGGEPGHEQEDWLQAENELLEMSMKTGGLAKAAAG